MKTVIENVRVVDEDKDFYGSVYIVDGRIEDFGEDLNYEGVDVINGGGRVLMPSFIDMHCHFRDPGFTYKEDLESGSRAALRGGYSYVNLMGNTNPVSSSMETINYVLDKSRDLDLIGIHQVMTITRNFDGRDLSHLDEMSEDVKIISDDGKGIVSNETMFKALKKAKDLDRVIMVHPEDPQISYINSRFSENIMTFRDLALNELVNAKLHIAHISTREIVEYMRDSKKKGIRSTCEVAPHHFALYDNDYKVSPSIREKEDCEAIIEAIKDGTIDMIATDHAPHTREDKLKGAPGISGIETSFSVSYTELVRKGHISLMDLSRLMSGNPSRLLDLNIGKIERNRDADLVLLDLDSKYKVDSQDFYSKGKNTPFNGREYYGQVIMTMRKGLIKYNGGL